MSLLCSFLRLLQLNSILVWIEIFLYATKNISLICLALLRNLFLFFQDAKPLEVFGSEYLVDGALLGFLGN